MHALPRSLRPRPYHAVLRRGTDAVRFGALPGHAVEAAGLSPPLRRLLLELHGSWPVAALLDRAVALGAEEHEARAVLAELHRAGALVDGGHRQRCAAARRRALVLVQGSGALLAAVAVGLARGGVELLNLLTEGIVPVDEVGVLPATDHGRTRLASAREAVRRVAPTARVRAGRPHAPPTLVVLADVDPAAAEHPALPDLPHLVVRLVDGVGVVGPLVLPGSSPCRRCLDLHRADHDPGWPAVAAGLAGRPGTASPATAVATAALAAEQALSALDALAGLGTPPRVVGTELVVDLCGATISSRRWSPHPRCACRAALRPAPSR